ncbi:MAG TPA: DoxX family protein [Candidatus Baltobacteraceae bacterium]|nr:DoxX family protein [Candidatus Baltobacteraceae bacterium]
MTLALTALRALIGLFFIIAGMVQVIQHDALAGLYARWAIPAPGTLVFAIGATEIVCGVLFMLGALTRPVGLLLATIMIGATLTAGRIEGGAYLVLPPLLFLLLVFFAWRSGRYGGRTPVRRPGVQ